MGFVDADGPCVTQSNWFIALFDGERATPRISVTGKIPQRDGDAGHEPDDRPMTLGRRSYPFISETLEQGGQRPDHGQQPSAGRLSIYSGYRPVVLQWRAVMGEYQQTRWSAPPLVPCWEFLAVVTLFGSREEECAYRSKLWWYIHSQRSIWSADGEMEPGKCWGSIFLVGANIQRRER